MTSQRDYILDIEGLADPSGGRSDTVDTTVDASKAEKGWLAVHWRCCHVYSRIYKTRDGLAYAGRCPKCGKAVRAKIAPHGTSARFFEAM